MSCCRACKTETCTGKQSTCFDRYLNNHNTGNIENYGSTVGTANLLSRLRLKWTLQKAMSVFVQTMKFQDAVRKIVEISDSLPVGFGTTQTKQSKKDPQSLIPSSILALFRGDTKVMQVALPEESQRMGGFIFKARL